VLRGRGRSRGTTPLEGDQPFLEGRSVARISAAHEKLALAILEAELILGTASRRALVVDLAAGRVRECSWRAILLIATQILRCHAELQFYREVTSIGV